MNRSTVRTISSDQDVPSILSSFARFAFITGISVLIWWRPLFASLALAWQDERYTHLLLIIPVSLALLYLDRKRIQSSMGSAGVLAYGLLASAVFASVVVKIRWLSLTSDEERSLNMLALVIWWMGAFAFAFGPRAFRRALFPICFLLWLVPFPEFLLNPIVKWLQEGSVISARLLFSVFGIPVLQDGTLLTIPKLTLEVAPECSSIRSSLILLVTTIVTAQLTLSSWWRKGLIIALAIPLSVAKNGVRVFVLAMLATHVDRTFLSGRLHHQGGVIYLALALAAVFLLTWLAHRNEERLGRRALRGFDPAEGPQLMEPT